MGLLATHYTIWLMFCPFMHLVTLEFCHDQCAVIGVCHEAPDLTSAVDAKGAAADISDDSSVPLVNAFALDGALQYGHYGS